MNLLSLDNEDMVQPGCHNNIELYISIVNIFLGEMFHLFTAGSGAFDSQQRGSFSDRCDCLRHFEMLTEGALQAKQSELKSQYVKLRNFLIRQTTYFSGSLERDDVEEVLPANPGRTLT